MGSDDVSRLNKLRDTFQCNSMDSFSFSAFTKASKASPKLIMKVEGPQVQSYTYPATKNNVLTKIESFLENSV